MQTAIDKLKAGNPVLVPFYYLDEILKLCDEQSIAVTVGNHIYDSDFDLDSYIVLPTVS